MYESLYIDEHESVIHYAKPLTIYTISYIITDIKKHQICLSHIMYLYDHIKHI